MQRAQEEADKKAEQERLAKEEADKEAEEERLAQEAADDEAEEERTRQLAQQWQNLPPPMVPDPITAAFSIF